MLHVCCGQPACLPAQLLAEALRPAALPAACRRRRGRVCSGGLLRLHQRVWLRGCRGLRAGALRLLRLVIMSSPPRWAALPALPRHFRSHGRACAPGMPYSPSLPVHVASWPTRPWPSAGLCRWQRLQRRPGRGLCLHVRQLRRLTGLCPGMARALLSALLSAALLGSSSMHSARGTSMHAEHAKCSSRQAGLGSLCCTLCGCCPAGRRHCPGPRQHLSRYPAVPPCALPG